MKQLLIVLALWPTALIAQAVWVDKPVICDRTDVVLTRLMSKDIREQPIWVGRDTGSQFTVFVNERTGAWTLVQFNTEIACILGMGDQQRTLESQKL